MTHTNLRPIKQVVMMQKVLASVCVAASIAAMAPGATAFAPAAAPMLRGSHLSVAKQCTSAPLVAKRSGVVGLRAQVGGFVPKEKTMDDYFAMLKDERFATHPHPTIRRMGYEAIAEKAINDGIVDEIVPRLIDMLTIEEMGERRSAVQALGIIGGDRVLKPIADLLLSTDDTTVRASCSKCLGAVALKNPETIPDFPQSALDGMKKAVLEIDDPVTKIATVSSLGQIGGGEMSSGFPGCERALDVLCDILDVTEDMGLMFAAVNAVGTIGTSNPDFAPKSLKTLRGLKERGAEGMDGFMYAESMINAAIDNLTGGGIVGDMQKGFADKENHAASASLTRQFVTASQTGMLEVESEYDMDFVAADDSDSDEDSDD